MTDRAFIVAETYPSGRLTGYLKVFVKSAKDYPQGRAFGTSTTSLAREMDRKTRRQLLAMTLRSARFSYQQRIREAVL